MSQIAQRLADVQEAFELYEESSTWQHWQLINSRLNMARNALGDAKPFDRDFQQYQVFDIKYAGLAITSLRRAFNAYAANPSEANWQTITDRMNTAIKARVSEQQLQGFRATFALIDAARFSAHAPTERRDYKERS